MGFPVVRQGPGGLRPRSSRRRTVSHFALNGLQRRQSGAGHTDNFRCSAPVTAIASPPCLPIWGVEKTASGGWRGQLAPPHDGHPPHDACRPPLRASLRCCWPLGLAAGASRTSGGPGHARDLAALAHRRCAAVVPRGPTHSGGPGRQTGGEGPGGAVRSGGKGGGPTGRQQPKG